MIEYYIFIVSVTFFKPLTFSFWCQIAFKKIQITYPSLTSLDQRCIGRQHMHRCVSPPAANCSDNHLRQSHIVSVAIWCAIDFSWIVLIGGPVTLFHYDNIKVPLQHSGLAKLGWCKISQPPASEQPSASEKAHTISCLILHWFELKDFAQSFSLKKGCIVGKNRALMKREKALWDGYQKPVDVHNSSQTIS